MQRQGYVIVAGKTPRVTEVKSGEIATVNLTLAPASSIVGRVVDADGVPVEFANVQVLKIAYLRAGRTTNERGEFRIYGLQPGKYLVLATPAVSEMPAEIRADGSREQQDIQTFYPNSTTVDGAMRVEVTEGASATGIEIRLARGPIVRVSGVLRGASEKEYPNFYLQPAGRSFDGMMLRQPQRKEGRFSYPRMTSGRFTLFAVTYGDVGLKASSEQVDLDVTSEDIDNLELDLQPPVDIEGIIKWTDEDKGKAVTLTQVDLNPGGRLQVGGSLFAQIEDGNAFHVKGVMRDRYPVSIATTTGYPAIQSVEMGGVEMPDGVLDLRHGAAGPVTIVLSPDMGQIAGKVENAKANAIVVLLPERATRGHVSESKLGPNSEYEFKSVPVGDYKLAVVDAADVPEILGSGSLGFYEADAKPLKVAAQDSLTIDLKQP